MKLNKHWPAAIFFMFLVLLVGAYLYYVPSWGLQDDFQSLGIARSVWQSDHFLGSLWDIITGDLASWGIFRPVYYASVVITYHFFKDIPWFIYILLAIFNFAAMFLWGVIISKIFSVKEDYSRACLFLFPLSFLIFTPFWNIFVHISFQEKYIVLFSALSLYFFEKTYCKEKLKYLIPTMAFMILGILSKPTGIYLAMACIMFAVIDIIFIKYKKRISLWVLLINAALFIFYYWFITSHLRGYASQYSLSVASITDSLFKSSMVIKLLMLIALIMGIWSFILILRKENNFSPLILMSPLGFLSYVLVLAPWRFVNYLLSALTPYILVMFFPVYLWMINKSKITKASANTCLIVLVAISYSFIAVPRVSKLADVRKTEEFIVSFNHNNDLYFFPPPFSEAAAAVSAFTSAKIVYLSEGSLGAEKLHKTKGNYLIVNDEASGVTLDGVKIGKTVYDNNTWKIVQLVQNNQGKDLYKVNFPENALIKFKTFLRDL